MAALTRQAILGDEFADLFADAAAPAPAAAVDMDSVCDKLTANLGKQLELYVAYKALAERQRMALINRRLSENVDVNSEVDKLLNSLGGLEEERIELTGPAVKCESLYPLVSADRAAKLKACRDDLVEAMGELKRVLDINQSLVENGSKIIHTTIGILTSVAGRSKTDRMNTYTAKGKVQFGKVQIRNLVNRSV